MKDILEILEKDARITPQEIAKMVGRSVESVKKAIKKMETDGIILKYKTVLNSEMLREEGSGVRALIEVKVTPQKGLGFDNVAERIYQFPEVTSCYLMSGTYDLLVVVEAKSLHAISDFVSEKLSSIQHVRGTVTHFILKKYKENGDLLKQPPQDKRQAILL
ncbi:MAG: Lrp/AsnC family transcriptional regulator [Candidatus Omnitrophica bacterium]|nr:Lrp/AsnC family transcriptional regulator [Candidatus Omnitrophota bacterium]